MPPINNESLFSNLIFTHTLSEYECSVKDGRPYLFHSFRNKYFNKISLGNMLSLYFQNKL